MINLDIKAMVTAICLLILPTSSFSADTNKIKEWKYLLDYNITSKDINVVISHFNRQTFTKTLNIDNDGAKTYLVYNIAYIDGRWIKLYIPNAPEDFGDIYEQCVNNKSYAYFSGAFTDLPINPLCSESSSIDDLSVSILFFKNSNSPYLSITTNGPACIPSWLYEINSKTNKFNLIAEACGG